ncbi:hypothetical protein, partial [Streptomyces sp. DSM 41033]|uniref:hypothetical protein n=1 Tax=Streptomyces sp. DSM 41033 TaxID=3448655 RepID=UPI00403FDADA
PVTTYVDNNNPTQYKAFLAAHNPSLAVPPKSDSLAAMGLMIQRPDILCDDGPRKEYYEIKPLSISGAAAGVLKLVFIVKFMSDLGLPYQRGMSYPNTANGAKDIPIMGGTVLGSQLDVILNVTRHAPGILTYSICLHGDLTALL